MSAIPKLNPFYRHVLLELAASQDTPKRIIMRGLESGKAISVRIGLCKWRKQFIEQFTDGATGHFNYAKADAVLKEELARGVTTMMLEMTSFSVRPSMKVATGYRDLVCTVYPLPQIFHVAPDGTYYEGNIENVARLPLKSQLNEGAPPVPVYDNTQSTEHQAQQLMQAESKRLFPGLHAPSAPPTPVAIEPNNFVDFDDLYGSKPVEDSSGAVSLDPKERMKVRMAAQAASDEEERVARLERLGELP